MNRQFHGNTKYKDFTSKDVEKYAVDHGYKYIKSQVLGSDESGYYMKSGYYNEKVDLVSWEEKGVEFEFYTRWMGVESLEKLSDSIENGTRSRLLLGLVFSIKLPYALPSVMVQSLTSKTIWNILGITQLFIGKKVKLEGDFNRFFKVYTPSGKASNAFLALAPDTMIKMLRAGSGMDFQFAGDRIYFMYDQRLKIRNYKNIWGLAGDFKDIKLNKPLAVPQIDRKEWELVFERSREYSLDILNSFRALNSQKSEPSLCYYEMNTRRLSLIVVFQMLIFITLCWFVISNLYILLIIIPIVTAWILYRSMFWKYRLNKLLKSWDEGTISHIVR